MRGVLLHLHYAWRLLLESPGFTITAVLVLGFGIGANTAVFSLIEWSGLCFKSRRLAA